jgi:predicted kinase
MIVIVFGLPGSGKSWVASRLASKIGAGYVNSDRVRKEMFGQRSYSPKEKSFIYDQMLMQVKEAIQQQHSLVIDATFFRRKIRKKFIYAVDKQTKIIFIEMKANEALIRERLKKSRPDSEADFEVYKKIKKQWQPMYRPHLVLRSGENNINELLEQTIRYLQLKNDNRTDT